MLPVIRTRGLYVGVLATMNLRSIWWKRTKIAFLYPFYSVEPNDTCAAVRVSLSTTRRALDSANDFG